MFATDGDPGDTLWVWVYDDPGKQISLTLNAGGGESETIELEETSSRGTYSGFIVLGDPAGKEAENGVLDAAGGGSVTAEYEEQHPVAAQPAVAAAKVPAGAGISAVRLRDNALFTAQSSGTLSLFTISGRNIASVRLTAAQTFQAPAHNGLLLWQWRGAAGRAAGRL